MVLMLFPIVGLLIFSIPFIETMIVFLISEKISDKEKRSIQKDIKLDDNILVTRFRFKDSQAYSIPFLKIIVLSNHHYKCLKLKNSDDRQIALAKLAHEIGHLKQYDRVMYRWLQGSTVVFWGYFFYVVYLEYLKLFTGSAPLSFDNIYLALLLLFALYNLYSANLTAAHRREYIADISGYMLFKGKFMSFIYDGVETDAIMNKVNRTTPKQNKFTHPDFTSRLHMIKGEIDVLCMNTIWVSYRWMLLLCFFIGASNGNEQKYDFSDYFVIAFFIGVLYYQLAGITGTFGKVKWRLWDYTKGTLAACISILFLQYIHLAFTGEFYTNPGYYVNYLELAVFVFQYMAVKRARNIAIKRGKENWIEPWLR